MSGRKNILSDSHIRQRSKFSNLQRYETHYPLRGFFLMLFSFQGLIIGLISTTVIFFYRSFCKVSTCYYNLLKSEVFEAKIRFL